MIINPYTINVLVRDAQKALRTLFTIPRAWGVLRGDKRQTARSASLNRESGNLPPVSSDRDGGSFSAEALRNAREVAAAKVEAAKPHSRARHWAEMELSRLTLELLRAENDAARG